VGDYFDIMNDEREYYPNAQHVEIMRLKEFVHTHHEKGTLHKLKYLDLLTFFPIMKKFKSRHFFNIS
jgi:hypothetical protein